MRIFDLHDVARKRSLSKKEVANVLRTCGRLATHKEMETLLASYSDPMSKTDFTELVHGLKPGPKESDLLVALQAFDHKELGTLSRVEVSSIFTQMTEKIAPSDLEAVLEGLPFADDRVPITALVAKLMTPMSNIRVPFSEVQFRMQK